MPIFSAPATPAPTATIPVSQATATAPTFTDRCYHAYKKLAFGLPARAAFYLTIADCATANLVPTGTIEDMRDVAQERWLKRKMVAIYQDLLDTLSTGAGLPAALAPWIPPAEAAMLRGAKEAGPEALTRAFAELGTLLGRQAEARRQLWKALASTGGSLLLMLAVMVEVVKAMVPTVVRSITPAAEGKMPFAMAYFTGASWVLAHGLWIVVACIAIVAGLVYALPNWASERRRFFDQYVPPFSLYQRLQATLFLSSAAAMLRAGIVLDAILMDMATYSTRWMHFHLMTMKAVLDSGDGQIASLSVGPLPNDTADTLRTYRRIPNFQDVMTRLAEMNFAAYERSIKALAVAMSVFSQFLMAAFALATMVSMFQFADAMRALAHAPG